MTILRILRCACIVLCLAASLSAQTINWQSSGGNTTTTDKVGIGTTAPSSILELSATAPIQTIRYTDSANYGCLYFYEATNPVGVLQYVGSNYATSTYRNALMLINWSAGPDIFFTSGAERMRIDASGNVGIGMTTPSRLLSFPNGTGEKLSLYANSSSAQDYYGFGIAGSELQYQVPAGAHHSFYAGTTEKVRIDASGNVGIGTTAPATHLDVTDAVYAGARIAVGQQTSVMRAGYNSFYFSELSSYIPAGAPGVDSIGWKIRPYYYPMGGRFDAVTVSPAGKVGIGTGTEPTALLQLAPPLGTVGFSQSANGAFYVDAPSTVGGRLTILEDGRVGIGTNSPLSGMRLDVSGAGHFSGNVTVDGSINAKYQDVAEWVPAGGTLQAGMVVVLNRNKANEVAPSMNAYDAAVAGVVSDQPGVLLGVGGANKAKIATTGRVKVRVDAKTHAIHIGDLLVTSDRPGMAMTSVPLDVAGVKLHRPGTLIGKALEALPSGEGEILVLLSLQ